MKFIFLRSRDNVHSQKGLQSQRFHVPVHRIIYVEQGEGSYDFDGDVLAVKSGDVFLASPGFRSIDYPDEQTVRMKIINFSAPDHWMEKPYEVFNERGRQYSLLIQMIDDMIYGLVRRREAMLQLALDLFIEQGELELSDNRLIHQIAEQIRANPQKKYSVAELAQQSGSSLSHFRALFKQETELSPKAFIKKCKMDYALKLLRDEKMMVKQVADLLGYNDIHEFSKQFKTVFSKSPTALSKRKR